MNYDEALDYLFKSYGPGKKQGFEIERQVLGVLGDPQKRLKVIHVAGTNGKGSACAMLCGILMAAGYKVGMFTSPHLMKFNERMRINLCDISDEDFAEGMKRVADATHEVLGNDKETLSFFEILTIMGFDYFYRNDVDYAIIEVGLGGRLDSTNVIDEPLVSVITSIGYDHMEQLGDTLPAIATEKAGIIQSNCPVVLYLTIDDVYNTIKKIAYEKNSIFYYLGTDYELDVQSMGLDGTKFSIKSEFFTYNNIEIKLLGEYQLYNAINVLLVVEALRNAGVKIDDAHVVAGLAGTSWAGRMEVVPRGDTLIVFDGAHNYDGAIAFNACMKAYFADYDIIMVVGILSSKDYLSMIKILSETPRTMIFTQPVSSKAVDADGLSHALETAQIRPDEIIVEPDYKKAVDTAVSLAGLPRSRKAVVVVTGSLYLVGDVKQYLIETT